VENEEEKREDWHGIGSGGGSEEDRLENFRSRVFDDSSYKVDR